MVLIFNPHTCWETLKMMTIYVNVIFNGYNKNKKYIIKKKNTNKLEYMEVTKISTVPFFLHRTIMLKHSQGRCLQQITSRILTVRLSAVQMSLFIVLCLGEWVAKVKIFKSLLNFPGIIAYSSSEWPKDTHMILIQSFFSIFYQPITFISEYLSG